LLQNLFQAIASSTKLLQHQVLQPLGNELLTQCSVSLLPQHIHVMDYPEDDLLKEHLRVELLPTDGIPLENDVFIHELVLFNSKLIPSFDFIHCLVNVVLLLSQLLVL
jgi:hypothetical protein